MSTSTLRNAIVGGWQLVSFSARDTHSGEVRQPLGAQPKGLILYTDDGYMSAQLTPDATVGGDYIAYGGTFFVDEDTSVIHHDVTISSRPELLLQPQFRHAVLDGNALTLSATTGDPDGTTTEATLLWRRASPPD